jgi:phosphoribosylformylglycinamidine synthase
MVGLIPEAERAAAIGLGFREEGHVIAMCGTPQPVIAGSELAKLRGEPLPTSLPQADFAAVKQAQDAVRDAVRAGDLASAHDIAEGGFLVAIAECCLVGGIGVKLESPAGDAPPPTYADLEPYLFGEAVGGFIVSGTREAIERLAERVPTDIFGTVGGDVFEVDLGGQSVQLPLSSLRVANGALAAAFS